MLLATDTPHAPWYIVRSDDKKKARLNCISASLHRMRHWTRFSRTTQNRTGSGKNG
jgi:polyphosphate kinase 2 (PPK2 family)